MGTKQDTDRRCETCQFFSPSIYNRPSNGLCRWNSSIAPEWVGNMTIGVRPDDGKLCPAWEPSLAEKNRQEMRDRVAADARAMAHAVGTGLTPLESALPILKFYEISPAWRDMPKIFWTVIRNEYPEKDFDVTLADFCPDKSEAIGDSSATPNETQS